MTEVNSFSIWKEAEMHCDHVEPDQQKAEWYKKLSLYSGRSWALWGIE